MSVKNRNAVTEMLTAPDKNITKTSGSNGVLSRLFRQMLWDLNINVSQFGSLLQNYVLNPHNGIPDNKKDQISARGNMAKELSKTQMTWKVFCKALRFLGIAKIDFSLKAYHYDGRTTLHSTTVNMGGRNEAFYKQLEQPEEQELVQDIHYLDPSIDGED